MRWRFLPVMLFLAAIAVLTPAPSPAATTEEPVPLQKGKPVEKTLTVGEVHLYRLNLSAGQAVKVIVDKSGVAAVATIYAPNGDKVGTFGSTTSAQGKEEITFLAESAGDYRLSVRTFFKPPQPGRYVISLAEIRAASDLERRGRAQQSCEEKSWQDSDNNFLVDKALDALSSCLGAVEQRLKKSNSRVSNLAGNAKDELSYLVGRWHWGEFVSPEYQESLRQDFRALAAAAAEPDQKRSAKIVEHVVEDIRIKAEHCRNSSHGLGPPIEVRVVTRRGTAEEKGWYVFYKSFLYEDQTGFAKRFPQQSSPTSTEMAPSRYFFWLAPRDDAPEPPQATQKVISIGKGLDKRNLDLSVP